MHFDHFRSSPNTHRLRSIFSSTYISRRAGRCFAYGGIGDGRPPAFITGKKDAILMHLTPFFMQFTPVSLPSLKFFHPDLRVKCIPPVAISSLLPHHNSILHDIFPEIMVTNKKCAYKSDWGKKICILISPFHMNKYLGPCGETTLCSLHPWI